MEDRMDRRQRKTRAAIFRAFTDLLAQKSYNRITVQEIIDAADVGRTTFYAHFETRDDLLRELCAELFDHILISAADSTQTHGLYSTKEVPDSVFCHLLQHLQENDNNILGLLSCESSELFLQYFKDSLNQMLSSQILDWTRNSSCPVPQDFLINHISSSFVDMVQWWILGGQKQSPEELAGYFEAVIRPIFS